MARQLTCILAALAAALIASAAHAESATIAVAANFKPAMKELEAAFEKESGRDLVVVAGSTGKLYAQIANGAPFDILLAADIAHPQKLAEEGFAEGEPFTYAIGRLALWAPGETMIDASIIARREFGKIAIANPKLAPYGAAAAEVIGKLEISTAIESKLVYGENIGQTFAFVETGAASAGFIAYSQLLTLPEEKRAAYWAPPQSLYAPIRQGGVLLTRAKDNDAAKEFIAFLHSPAAEEIIRRSGYEIP